MTDRRCVDYWNLKSDLRVLRAIRSVRRSAAETIKEMRAMMQQPHGDCSWIYLRR